MTDRTITYQPALDGLRAVAVLLVLVFHAGFAWMPAGYLGVSVFFTLSGFLITRLLLAEHDRTGSVSFGAFYGRRLRRLLPASVLCLVLVMIARAFGAFSRVEGLRSDIVGAALQVFNWVSLAGETSYGELFNGGVSPLEHFWSLAIEEQFYWVWPAVFVVIARRCRRRGWGVVAPVAVLTLVFAAGAPLIAVVWGADAAYWATPARLAEILVGALLACWVGRGGVVPAGARHVALPALAVIVALSCVLPSGSGPAYEGALPLVAVVSGVVLWSLQVPGAVHSVLSVRPLVGLGKISYGVYLYHWPIDTLLRERGWRLDTVGGFAVAFGLTLALTLVSYVALEQPVRRATWQPRLTMAAAAAATACVALLTVTLPAAEPVVAVDQELLDAASIDSVDGSLAPLQSTPSTTTPAATTPAVTSPGTTDPAATSTTATAPPTTLPLRLDLPPVPARPVRILVVGDSTSLYVAEGLAAWSVDHPTYARTTVRWAEGLTFLLEPEIVTFDTPQVLEQSRRTVGELMPAAVAELRPDVVVLMVTVNDSSNRRWSSDEGVLAPYDARYRDRLRTAYEGLTDQLLTSGVPEVAWVLPATPYHLWLEPEMNEPDRYFVQHDVIREIVAAGGDRVSAVDFHGWLTASGLYRNNDWRPDGVHLTTESAADLAEQWLGPLLVTTALGG